LAESDSSYLQSALIYSHGSIAHGTTVKPVGRNEFDADLVCLLPGVAPQSSTTAVKALIGDRLKAHGRYDGMLEEKQRCWRINYANEFHLDITPAILNPQCAQGGELVPDRRLTGWKPTNPRGYTSRFEQYAALRPRFHLREAIFAEKRAEIQEFPKQTMSKPFLKRIIQLLKRHRDIAFVSPQRRDLAPISIILTTLASWSYAYCVKHHTYTDGFELIVDVVRRMPDFIAVEQHSSGPHFLIANETTTDENFADKWNHDSRLAEAFFGWHREVVATLGGMLDLEGTDRLSKGLQESFGASQEQIRQALLPLTASVSRARTEDSLLVAPAVGLLTSPAPDAVRIRPNTFFGR
jgi:hypothetical protein